MPNELLPVRVSDRLTLGRLFGYASSRGYDAMCDFLDAMEAKGVSHLKLLDYLAEYREWSDARKFHEIMEDDSVVDAHDRGMNIRIGCSDGSVRVREVPVEQIEAEESCQISVATCPKRSQRY